MKPQTKVVECALGCKTSEDMARHVDELLKTIPEGCRKLVKKSGTDTQVSDEPRTDISTITTSLPDRDGEIVLPDGIELEEYQKNPVVLYGHNQELPVGKSLWIKPNNNGLLAKTLYPARPSTFTGEWLSDFVFEMIKADVLKGKSIGFLPLDYREPSPEELAQSPDVQRVITRACLVEYSVVALPSNPAALVEAINKGLTKLEHWGFEVVGKIKKKPVKKKVKKPFVMPEFDLNPDDIAQEVIDNILKRWEA